jgi:hypothetical protein
LTSLAATGTGVGWGISAIIIAAIAAIFAGLSAWYAKSQRDQTITSNRIANEATNQAKESNRISEEALQFQKVTREDSTRKEVTVTLNGIDRKERVPAILLTATNTGGQKVYLRDVVVQADGIEIDRSDFNFISPGLDADTFIEPNQHNQQKIMAHSFEPAIKRQTGTTNNTVQVTAYFVDGEGKHWLADSSVPFDLNKDYVGGPRIDFL